ncbi:MAG: hypothetical protein ABIW38_15560, partial [Ferruginibacter sp.]
CGGPVTETWTATDACQRVLASVSRVITVSPAALPTMTAPGPITVACGAVPAPSTLSFTNGLSGGCLISGTSNPSTFSATPGVCGGPVTETWTATDACGRTVASVSRVITVSPAAAAVFVNAPGNITATLCGVAPLPGSLSYSNGLTGNCEISGSVTSVITGGNSINCGTYTETWSFTDPCGRGVITHVRTIEVPCCGACTFTQGAYGNSGGNHCNEDGTTSLSLAKIQRALTLAGGSYTFGRNTRTFTLYYADAIHVEDEMLPGGGNSQMFDAGGARWSMVNTWNRVPLQIGGRNNGKIKNTLFAQTLTMWLNLQNSTTLGGLPIADTIWTVAMTTCGSNIPTGPEAKFGIPHDVVIYLANPANGYTNNVAGLFQLANDVLGGVNTTVNAGNVATAVDVFNNAYDECRMMSRFFNLGGINAPVQNIVTQSQPLVEVTAHPNPYTDKVVFTIRSAVSGNSSFEIFGLLGEKMITLYQGFIEKGSVKTITYEVPNVNRKTLVYQFRIGKEMVTGKVIYPN